MGVVRLSICLYSCAGYFLEDAIEMTNFRPTPRDRKKKVREVEDLPADPEEVRT